MSKINNEEEIREVIVEKNVGFNMIEVIVMIIISILFGILVGSVVSNSRKTVDGVKVSHELQEFITTYNNINDNYYGKISEQELVSAAIEGMITKLDDPYSVYMDNKETENFNTTIDGSYTGIGATVSSKDGNNYIVSLFDKSPAEKSGLKVGDIFVKVNGKDVKGMELDKLTSLIKGKANTVVDITVLRDGKEITKTITRSSIDILSFTSKVIEKNKKKVGYIYISTFAANSYKQFNKELSKLEKENIDSLIIDVRSNPGGHLTQVTKILELFMDKKKVIYQVESKGKRIKKYSTTAVKRDYNVSVLINPASASASEILAAAFKESYDKATLVGEKSYGKGTVQKAYQLSNGASFKYTTEKWLTPKGNWIDKAGVKPDVEVKLDEKYKKDPSDKNDLQLQKALDILTK